jgi:chitinase
MFIHSSKIRSFLRKLVITGGAGVLLAGVLSQAAIAQTKVVGYIQVEKGLINTVDRTDMTKLTHLNLAFANPNSAGVFLSGGNPVCMAGGSASAINYAVQRAHAAGVKVLISIAGGVIPECSGNWGTLVSPAMRGTVVSNAIQFMNTFNLDGIDVDIEGANIDSNYTPFIQALRSSLPAGKLLTSATATYIGGRIPASSLPYFDFVNIMSYDAVGPWPSGRNGGEHSTLSQAENDIAIWSGLGLSKDKLVLGVPFYGYGFNGFREAYGFGEIVAEFGASVAQNDVIGASTCAGCTYITYNGIPTIRAKTRLGLARGTGVMIWELAHDGTGAYSLLNVIDTEIKGGVTSSSSSRPASSSSSSVTTGSCPAWVEGRQYNVGDKVTYQGGYYIAEYANPGYIPTVSTYFWEPISASQCGSVTSSSRPASSSSSRPASSSSSLPSSSSSSVAGGCPAWVQGRQYNAGDKVSYLGGYYIAEFANPGYTPTVSTYFWEPISASQCGGTSPSSSSSATTSSVGAFTRTIQAEAYSVMNGVQLETTQDPQGGGQNVGWIDATDWMTYASVNFPTSGSYRVEYRVASQNGGGTLDLNLNAGSISLGQLAIPNTGSWQVWTTISHNVTVTAGTYNMGVYAVQGGWNINWIKITKL